MPLLPLRCTPAVSLGSVVSPADERQSELGGNWYDFSNSLAASTRDGDGPPNEDDYIGFRVASVPRPSTLTLLWMRAFAFLA